MLRIHKIRPECIGCINPNLCILPKTSRNDNFRFEVPPGLNTSQHDHTPRSRAWNSSQHPHPTDKHLLVEELQDPPGNFAFAHVFMIRFFFFESYSHKETLYKNEKTHKFMWIPPIQRRIKNQGYWFYHTNISAGHQSSDRAKGQAPPAKYQAKEQPFLHTASKKQKIPLLKVVYNSCWKQFVSKRLLHRDTIQYAQRYDKFE